MASEGLGMRRKKREEQQQKEKKGNAGESRAETSLLSVTLLAFDVHVPLGSISSGLHSGAVEHREPCLSGVRGVRVDDWGCLCWDLTGLDGAFQMPNPSYRSPPARWIYWRVYRGSDTF